MTAVLQPTDALRSRGMSLDDADVSYSSGPVDWRAKYNEVADMLAETRAELDDFHHASKELETELENELARTEKTQQDLKVKVARAETEKDEWKSKFMSLQTTHNSTTTSLQRELDKLRQEHQRVKVQLRELEMGNDDLERTERAISSSLADVEAKYSRALEEKIILEHELLDKANLEEQCQRLKDDLRDANIEISVLRDQLQEAKEKEKVHLATASTVFPDIPMPSSDDLLDTAPPPDLSLSELDPSTESLTDTLASEEETPRKHASLPHAQSSLLQRARVQPTKSVSTPPSAHGIPRSSTLPSIYTSPRTATRPTTTPRPPAARNPSSMSTTSTTSTTSRNKGVQMVSEMRARVRNLEQKIHTRVPRLRMGSTASSKPISSSLTTPVNGSSPFAKSIVGKSSWENPLAARRSAESQRKVNGATEKAAKESADSSGWVLIMEDSPSPPRNRDKERRRASSPLGTSSFRPTSSAMSPISPTMPSKPNSLFQSTANPGLRRPASRLSAGSSGTATSIPTSSSRPSTPTFLPIPTTGLTSLKRSNGASTANLAAKRSSLGSSTNAAVPQSEFLRSRPSSTTSSNSSEYKSLPQLPGMANITVRPSKLAPSTSSSLLAQSRIGRPSAGRRKSSDEPHPDIAGFNIRPRSGSTAAG